MRAKKNGPDTLLVALNAKYIHTALGARSIAAYCAEEFWIDTLELTINDTFDSLREQIFLHRAPIVGFSCYIWNIDRMLKLAESLHHMDPSVAIVLGGPEVSYNAPELLENHPFVDAIITGEGEVSWQCLLRSKNLSAVPGTCFRDSSSGKIVQNPAALPIPGDELPFGYDWENLPAAPQILYYESSRGCPFRCAFCLSRDAVLRYRNAQETIDHLCALGRANVHQVKLVDRTFNADPVRAATIWGALIHLDTRTNYHFEIAAHLLDDATLNLLEGAPPGRFQFEIGVQSTNKATLYAIDRPDRFADITHVVQALSQSGNIHLHLDLIAGLPHEGLPEFERSFNDVLALGSQKLQLGFLKLLRGSRLREIASSFGCAYADFAPYEVLRTDSLTSADLLALKHTESALELYQNALHCPTALHYLLAKETSAFAFFMQLGSFVTPIEKSLQKPLARLQALWRFCEHTHRTDDVLRELLRFDYHCKEKQPQPLFDEELDSAADAVRIRAFYRNHATALIGSQRQPWRVSSVKRFSLDTPAYQANGRIRWQTTYVLFDYENNRRTDITNYFIKD